MSDDRYTVTFTNNGVDADQPTGTVRLIVDLPFDVAFGVWQALGRELIHVGDAVKAAYPDEWAEAMARADARRKGDK